MKIKSLMGLVLICAPFIAYANGAIQFNLLNSSSSPIPNPIHITGGYIQYSFFQNGADEVPTGCPTNGSSEKVDLNTIIGPSFPISLGTESKFTFTFPSSMAHCFNGSAYSIISLLVTEVDGIKKQEGYGYCGVYGYAMTNTDTGYASMNIIETTDNFYCNSVGYKK